jgi:hypothetical protein
METFDLLLFEDIECAVTAEERASRKSDIERIGARYDEIPVGLVMDAIVATRQSVAPPVLLPPMSRC